MGQGLGQLGSAFRGAAAPQLFVSNAHNGPTLGTISAYRVMGNGNLTPIGASPFPDTQTAPCWVTISPDGRFLFTTNTGSSTISSFQTMGNGSLAFVSTTGLNGGSGLGAIDLRIDATGRTLYQLESPAHKIGVLAVTGGTLQELSSSPVLLPAGGSPSGLAMT
jgi:hypothetical protein